MGETYRFVIRYYYDQYHTGSINTNLTRIGMVNAKSLKEAHEQIKEIDDEYICDAENGVTFTVLNDKETENT